MTTQLDAPSGVHPQLRLGLERATDADGRVIVTDPANGRQVRLSAGATAILDLCDGARDHAGIAAALGLTDVGEVERALHRFGELGLVAGPQPAGWSATRPPRRPRRLRWRPPGTLELALVDPSRWMDRLAPLTRLAGTGPARSLGWLLGLCGLVLAASAWPALHADLTHPAAAAAALAAFAILLASIAVHELAHAASLSRRGGRVRRLGVMVLYGSPAMFADVSEAWRLDRRSRVQVALAGLRVNLLTAAGAGIVLRLAPAGATRETAALVLAGQLVFALINLCPLVKFDGYVALIGWLDAPHLRRRCMAEAGDALRSLALGGRRRLRSTPGRIVYGVACALAAPALVGFAALSYEPLLLAALGSLGAVLVAAALSFTVLFGARKLARAFSAAVRAGASTPRAGFGLGLAVALVLGASVLVQVPAAVTTAYAAHGTGTYAVIPDGRRVGGRVTLERSGALLRSAVATGRTCGAPRRMRVPAFAGAPVRISSTATTLVTAVAVCDLQGAPGRDGIAVIHQGRVSVAGWLYRTFFRPALARAA